MLGEMLRNLRKNAPRLHCITNYVTANDCANLLLACGAHPIMADDPDEAAEIVSACTGLVLNLGVPNPRKLETMRIAGSRANECGIPVVLDPVGVGASHMRMQAVQRLLQEVKIDAIRGNSAEIAALSSGTCNAAGVDALTAVVENDRQNWTMAKALASKIGAIVVLTGKRDIVTDGKIVYCVDNGCETMRLVTGTGCMLTCLMGAFLAANRGEKLMAALAAVCAMGVCGERASEQGNGRLGNASMRANILDTMCGLTERDLEREARYAIIG